MKYNFKKFNENTINIKLLLSSNILSLSDKYKANLIYQNLFNLFEKKVLLIFLLKQVFIEIGNINQDFIIINYLYYHQELVNIFKIREYL